MTSTATDHGAGTEVRRLRTNNGTAYFSMELPIYPLTLKGGPELHGGFIARGMSQARGEQGKLDIPKSNFIHNVPLAHCTNNS